MLFRLLSQEHSTRILAGAAAAIFLLATPMYGQAGTGSDSATQAREAYSQKIAKAYVDRFSAGHPFLPSNMTTDNGQFIDPKSYPSAEYCGHCHQEAHAEWRQSAHSNSFGRPGICTT